MRQRSLERMNTGARHGPRNSRLIQELIAVNAHPAALLPPDQRLRLAILERQTGLVSPDQLTGRVFGRDCFRLQHIVLGQQLIKLEQQLSMARGDFCEEGVARLA